MKGHWRDILAVDRIACLLLGLFWIGTGIQSGCRLAHAHFGWRFVFASAVAVLSVFSGLGVILRRTWARRSLQLVASVVLTYSVIILVYGLGLALYNGAFSECFNKECGGDPRWCEEGCSLIFAFVFWPPVLLAIPAVVTLWLLKHKAVTQMFSVD